jgi:hypothetical protein
MTTLNEALREIAQENGLEYELEVNGAIAVIDLLRRRLNDRSEMIILYPNMVGSTMRLIQVLRIVLPKASLVLTDVDMDEVERCIEECESVASGDWKNNGTR